jgi:hypothetical protein
MFVALFPVGNAVAVSETIIDIKGHWAERDIREWIEKGIITGYPDQTFRPDQVISRGEFISLVNKAFQFADSQTSVTFKDLKSTDWVYKQVQTAVAQGYINGYSDQTFRQKQLINRQETATILNKLLKLNEIAMFSTISFSDTAHISGWSKTAIHNMIGLGIMEVGESNAFQPLRETTRAEAVVSIKKALASSVTDQYTKPGTYGGIELESINKDVVVDAANITLRNMHIRGNLLISEKVGDGDVYLEGVKVDGTTRVEGGGLNSIHMLNSTISSLIVNRLNGSVRIVAEGNTRIDHSEIISSAKLEESELEGIGFTTVLVTGEQGQALNGVSNAKTLTLVGDFSKINIDGPISRLAIQSGKIDSITVRENLSRINITTTKDSNIDVLDLQSNATITGEGQFKEISMGNGAQGTTLPNPLLAGGAGVPPPGGSVPPPVINPTPVNPPKVFSLQEIVASNGRIHVKFNKTPDIVPVVEDFEVTVRIDSGASNKVEVEKLEATTKENEFLLTIPTVENGDTIQTVMYTVKHTPTSSTVSASFQTQRATSTITGNFYYQPYNMQLKSYSNPVPFRGIIMSLEGIDNQEHYNSEPSTRTGAYTFDAVKPGIYNLYTQIGWTLYTKVEKVEVFAGQDIHIPSFIVKEDAPKINMIEELATDLGILFGDVWYLDNFSLKLELENGKSLNLPAYTYDQFFSIDLLEYNSDLVLVEGMKLYLTISATNGWSEKVIVPVVERPQAKPPIIKDIVYDDNKMILVTTQDEHSYVTIKREDGTEISRDHSSTPFVHLVLLTTPLVAGEKLYIYVYTAQKRISEPLIIEVQAPTEKTEVPEMLGIEYDEFSKRITFRGSTDFDTMVYVKRADGTILANEETGNYISNVQIRWDWNKGEDDLFYVYAKRRGKVISDPLIVKVPVTEAPSLTESIFSGMTTITGEYKHGTFLGVNVFLKDMTGNEIARGQVNAQGVFTIRNLSLTAHTQYQLIAHDRRKRESDPFLFTVQETTVYTDTPKLMRAFYADVAETLYVQVEPNAEVTMDFYYDQDIRSITRTASATGDLTYKIPASLVLSEGQLVKVYAKVEGELISKPLELILGLPI